MANSTDKSILTAAGKALLAQLNAEEKALVIDKMIFANVPNRPEYPQPDDVVPTEHIVHQEQVEQRGRLSADSVIYSTTLTSDVGPFDFNWTGAYCSEYGVLVTIDHHALTPKTADEPGVAGNTLVRSVVLEYKDIAEITNITVDASSWQYNATERMKKMDSDVAQSIIDQNGKDWFIEDGFLVTPSGSAYSIKAGAGYVSGNRVAMEFDRSVQVPNKPSFIYIDAHREGTPTGEQVTLFNFVVTAEEKDDYIDSSTGKDVKHFVCKIAQVLGDGSLEDLRGKKYIDSPPAILNKRTTFNLAGLDFKGGDNLRDALIDAKNEGAKEIFLPKSENGKNYEYKGGMLSLGSFTKIVGDDSQPIINVDGDFIEFGSTYYSGINNLILEGSGEGVGVHLPKGLKNFCLNRIRLGNFESPLIALNAYQGEFKRLNIERCLNGPEFVNAYNASISNLVVHHCGPVKYSGRAAVNNTWDISYSKGHALEVIYGQGVEFRGLYIEDNKDNPMIDRAIVLAESGDKGVSFSSVDISLLKNGAEAFSSDNASVDTDISFQNFNIKADGAQNIVGFNLGNGDSRFKFLSKPNFITDNGGTFAAEIIAGNNTYYDLDYGDFVERYLGRNVITAEYKYLESRESTSPNFARREFEANYHHRIIDIQAGIYFDITMNGLSFKGFVEILSPDGVAYCYVNDGQVSILSDSSGICSTSNVAGSESFYIGFSGETLKVRNNFTATKKIMIKPLKQMVSI